jgi:hypothetical protein
MYWYHMGCTSYMMPYNNTVVGEAFTDSPVAPSYYRHLIVGMQKSCSGPDTFLKRTIMKPMYQKSTEGDMASSRSLRLSENARVSFLFCRRGAR